MDHLAKIPIQWIDRWNYLVKSVGRDVSEVNHSLFKKSRKKQFLLLLITEGRGRALYKNEITSLCPSDCLFMPVSHLDKLDLEYAVGKFIIFEFLEDDQAVIPERIPNYIRKVNDLLFISQFMDRVIRMHHKKGVYKQTNVIWMRTLMYELANVEESFDHFSGINLENFLKIEEICEKVKKDPGAYSVNTMADSFHSTAEHFSRVFKKFKSINPKEYLIGCKVDWAKAQIKNSKKSISSIAYEAGYRTPQFFVKIFKQRMGLTPNQYRKNVVSQKF